MINIVVKVGKKSELTLNNCNQFRAITVEEMIKLSNTKRADVVVIEAISKEETDKARDFVRSCREQGKHVIFYIEDYSEEFASGVADELLYDIIMDKDSLHNEIYRMTGVYTNNRLGKRNVDEEEIEEIEEQFETFESEDVINTEIGQVSTLELHTETDDTEDDVESTSIKNEIDRSNEPEVEEEVRAEELNKYELEIARLLKEIESLNTELNKEENNQFNNKIKELSNEIARLKEDKEKLKAEKEKLEAEKARLELESINLYKDKEILEKKLGSISRSDSANTEKINELSTAIIALNEKIVGYEETISILSEDADNYRKAVESRVSIIASQNEDIERLEKQTLELNGLIEEKDNSIARHEESIKNKEDKISTLEEEVDSLKSKLNIKNKELNDIIEKIGGSIDVALSNAEEVKELAVRNTELYNKIKELETDAGIYKGEIVRLTESVEKHKEESRVLKESLSSIKTSGGSIVKKIKYSGKAKIISVFGTGNSGITTFAVSTATALGSSSKVLLIDMDLTSPSLDQWVMKSPYSQDNTIPLEKQYRTGIGVLLKSGFDRLMHYGDMVREYRAGVNGKIDYINGLYGSIEESEIAVAEYSKLLDYFGSKYDYIVIDSGRVGESTVKNSLIRELSNISHKAVCLINASKVLKTSLAINKLRNSGVGTNNILAVLNMQSGASMPEALKSILNGIDYVGISIEPQMINKDKSNFESEKLIKAKFINILKDKIIG